MRLGKVVMFLVIVLFLTSYAGAQETTNIKRDLDIFKADIKRDLESMKEDIKEDNRIYNDENYMVLDQRINAFLVSERKRAIIGILGLNVFVASLAGFFYNWVFRKNLLKRKLKDKRVQAQVQEQAQPAFQQPQFQHQPQQPQYQQPFPQQYEQQQQQQNPNFEMYGYDQFFDQQQQEQAYQQEATPSFIPNQQQNKQDDFMNY